MLSLIFPKLSLIYVLGFTKSLNILLSLILNPIWSKLDTIGWTGALFDLSNESLYMFEDDSNQASPLFGILNKLDITLSNFSNLFSKYKNDGILTDDVASSELSVFTKLISISDEDEDKAVFNAVIILTTLLIIFSNFI